jgi:hypothetical protein
MTCDYCGELRERMVAYGVSVVLCKEHAEWLQGFVDAADAAMREADRRMRTWNAAVGVDDPEVASLRFWTFVRCAVENLDAEAMLAAVLSVRERCATPSFNSETN